MTTTPISKAAEALTMLYSKKTTLDIEHKVKIAPMEAQIKLLEEKLIKWFDSQGVDKSNIAGIEYTKKSRVAYVIADKQSFWEWITQSPTGFSFYRDSVIQKEIKSFLESSKMLPPGINKTEWRESKLKLKP